MKTGITFDMYVIDPGKQGGFQYFTKSVFTDLDVQHNDGEKQKKDTCSSHVMVPNREREKKSLLPLPMESGSQQSQPSISPRSQHILSLKVEK